MFRDLMLPLLFLIGVTLWVAISRVLRDLHIRQQREIAARGKLCHGRVVAIQRPFLLDSCTRLYFEFAPPGFHQPLRCCHVERRALEEIATELPAAGTMVTVRYLPERPRQAVIGKLVYARR
jgi:hypothetical protein